MMRRVVRSAASVLDFKEPGGPDDRWADHPWRDEERQMMSDQGVCRVVDDEYHGAMIGSGRWSGRDGA